MFSFQRKLVVLSVFLGTLNIFPLSRAAPQYDQDEEWKPEIQGSVLESTLVRYYLFDYKNPEEVQNGGVLQLEEVGPFTYREKRVKKNLKRLEEDKLQYDAHWSMHYIPELTGEGLSEETIFSSVNVPFVALANGLEVSGLPKGFNDILMDEVLEAGDKIYTNGFNVGDLLFYGYNISLYTDILDDITQGQTETRYPEFANGTFSFYKNKNNTILANYTVESTPDIPFGRILSFKDNSSLGFYGKNTECDVVQGSLDLFTFPKRISKNTILKVFLPENCRSVRLEFVHEDVYMGIPVYVFKFPLDQFSNNAYVDETSCYCLSIPNSSNPQCLDAGLMDYSGCSKGAPLVGSFPHFLYANPRHLRNVKGIMPNKSLHESEVMIEPITGTPLYAVRRFQLNVKLQPYPAVTHFENMTERIMPLAWFEHILEVPSSTFTTVRDKLDRLKLASTKDIYHHDEHPLEEMDDNTLFSHRGAFPSKSGSESNEQQQQRSAASAFSINFLIFYVSSLLLSLR